MNVRRLLLATASFGLIAGGTIGGLAATSASAAPPPPPPPVVIHTTSVQTSDIHLSPAVQVLRFAEYQPQPAAPGFHESATILEVCVNIPHVVPPLPLTPTAICNWRLTATGALPHNTLSGTAFLNGDGQVGRVVSGTHAWAGAHSLPGGFLSLNLAPRTAADTFTFTL